MYIILLDYNYCYMNVHFTLMLQLVKEELTLFYILLGSLWISLNYNDYHDLIVDYILNY